MAADANVFWGVTIFTAIPAAIASFRMEAKRKTRMSGTKPYTWGIYVGLHVLLLGAVFVAAGSVGFFLSGEDFSFGTGVLVTLVGCVYVGAGLFTIRRYRAAFVVATAISFNVFWWIANAFYIWNRWTELLGVGDRFAKRDAGPAPRREQAPSSEASV
jgi:hypothetical protein